VRWSILEPASTPGSSLSAAAAASGTGNGGGSDSADDATRWRLYDRYIRCRGDDGDQTWWQGGLSEEGRRRLRALQQLKRSMEGSWDTISWRRRRNAAVDVGRARSALVASGAMRYGGGGGGSFSGGGSVVDVEDWRPSTNVGNRRCLTSSSLYGRGDHVTMAPRRTQSASIVRR
jgi:hypothetical protein